MTTNTAQRRGPALNMGRLGEVLEEEEPVEPARNDTSVQDKEPVVSSSSSSSSSISRGGKRKMPGTVAAKGSLATRLPAIREQRLAVNRKSRTSSFQHPLLQHAVTPQLKHPDTNSIPSLRKSSTLAGTSPGAQSILAARTSKLTFAGIGRRVSSLVRARLAFQGSRGRLKDKAEDSDHMAVIHQLPSNPRFSTFLSAEAQYAMMKGYEDKLYEKLTHTDPDASLVLKRSKTPHQRKISIVIQNEDEPENKSAVSSSGNDSTVSPPPQASVITPSSADAPEITTTATSPNTETTTANTNEAESVSQEESSLRPESTLSRASSVPSQSPFLRPLRRHSDASSVGESAARSPGGRYAFQSTHSLPGLKAQLSHNRRLVLTYRLESAMDILDTLKRRDKENSLSPRVFHIQRRVEPVKDFNSWTKVWNREFKVMQGK